MIRLYAYLFSGLCGLSLVGVLRYCLGVSIEISTYFALFFLVGCFGLMWATIKDRETSAYPCVLVFVLTAVWSAVLFFTVYSKAPRGLFAIGGADNASHLSLAGEFLYYSNTVYEGFVILYGLTAAIVSLLNLDLVHAFSFSMYGLFVLALMFFAIIVYKATHEVFCQPVPVLASIALVTFGFVRLFLPLVYYNVGEGFWPHITAIVVLAAAWAGHVALPTARARIVLLLASVVLYRFFYGLNLGDLCLTVGVMLLLEFRQMGPRPRLAVGILSCAFFSAGIFSYSKLLSLAGVGGGIMPHNRVLAWKSAVALVVLGLFSCVWFSRRIYDSSQQLKRYRSLIFPLVFSGISLTAEELYMIAELPEQYYILKYGLHRALLLAFAAPLLIATLLAHVQVSKWNSTSSILILVLVCSTALASRYLSESYSAYRSNLGLFLNPSKGRQPDMLFSPTVIKTIREVLTKEKKEYIATIGTQFPTIPFLNTYMSVAKEGRTSVFTSLAIMDSGVSYPPSTGCVFWFKRGPFHSTPLYFPHMYSSLQRYNALPTKTCLKRTDERGRKFKVCYVCG